MGDDERYGGDERVDDDLLDASTEVLLNAPVTAVTGCALLPNVRPVLAVAPQRSSWSRKGLQAKARRLIVRLSTDVKFTGNGTLSSTTANDFLIFDSKGVVHNLPMTIPGAKLSKGVTLYIEGAHPSAGTGLSQLSLSLAGGNKNIVNSPAADTFTCVEVTPSSVIKSGDGGRAPRGCGGQNRHGPQSASADGGWLGRPRLSDDPETAAERLRRAGRAAGAEHSSARLPRHGGSAQRG